MNLNIIAVTVKSAAHEVTHEIDFNEIMRECNTQGLTFNTHLAAVVADTARILALGLLGDSIKINQNIDRMLNHD